MSNDTKEEFPVPPRKFKIGLIFCLIAVIIIAHYIFSLRNIGVTFAQEIITIIPYGLGVAVLVSSAYGLYIAIINKKLQKNILGIVFSLLIGIFFIKIAYWLQKFALDMNNWVW